MSLALYSHLDQILSTLPKGRTEVAPERNFQIFGQLMSILSNPQKSLRNVIHVAGTNGKGSTVASLKAFLESQGYTVNAYTSPHLVYVTERILLQNHQIDPLYLLELLNALMRLHHQCPFNYFHALTACAFLAFKEYPADYTILEVGMGGRFDATNVFKAPLATVFTPLSLDHQPFLGASLKQIAAEKLCIVKTGIPMLSAAQPQEVEPLFETYAQELRCELQRERESWQYHSVEDGFIFQYKKNAPLRLPIPNLAGAHQLQNVSLSLATLSALNLINNHETLSKSLNRISLQGRLMETAYKGSPLWIDGAHNVSAAQILAYHSRTSWKGEKLQLVFSMSKKEDVYAFLKFLKPYIHVVYCPFMNQPFVDRSLIERSCWTLKIPYRSCDTLETALTLSLKERSMKTLVTGSLYLVGEVLKLIQYAEHNDKLLDS